MPHLSERSIQSIHDPLKAEWWILSNAVQKVHCYILKILFQLNLEKLQLTEFWYSIKEYSQWSKKLWKYSFLFQLCIWVRRYFPQLQIKYITDWTDWIKQQIWEYICLLGSHTQERLKMIKKMPYLEKYIVILHKIFISIYNGFIIMTLNFSINYSSNTLIINAYLLNVVNIKYYLSQYQI